MSKKIKLDDFEMDDDEFEDLLGIDLDDEDLDDDEEDELTKELLGDDEEEDLNKDKEDIEKAKKKAKLDDEDEEVLDDYL